MVGRGGVVLGGLSSKKGSRFEGVHACLGLTSGLGARDLGLGSRLKDDGTYYYYY